MTISVRGIARVSAAAWVAVAPVLTAPGVAAVTPPVIDDSLLPAPRPPAPPQPTEQAAACVAGQPSSSEREGRQLADLDLRSAWALSRGAGQTVAVIDTGVARHRLLPRLLPGGDYVSTGDGTDDCDGHGTIVAGIVGATPEGGAGLRFSGVAPEATVLGIRQSSNTFRAEGSVASGGFGDVDTLAAAVRTAADMGATVINISTVACVPVATALDDGALGAALAYAVDVKNVVVVAAAGNVGAPGQCPEQNPAADPARPARPDWSGVKVVVSPAWYDDYVLTVGSVGRDGAPSPFSLAGPWVDVAAPGEDVVALDRDGEGLIDMMPTASGEKPIAGTSYAAPVVSGVVALLRSRTPHLTARQVMQRIEDTARRPAAGWDPVVGHGVIDVLAAVTGSTSSRPTVNDVRPQTLSHPEARGQDHRPVRLALRGAALCLVSSVAVIATTVSARRLRR